MKKTLLLVGIITVLFTACAKQPEIQSSLITQKNLKQSKIDESVYYHLKDGVDFKQYNKVIVPRIGIEELPIDKDLDKEEQMASVLDEKVKQQVSTYFTQSISKVTNGAISKNPGNRTLKLDIAIEKVDVAYEDLKFYNFIPVSLAIKGITRGTGIEDKDALVVIAMRLTDVQNQEVIALAIDSKKIENVNQIKDITFEKIQPLLDEWVTKFKIRLEDFSKGVYKDL